MEQKTRSEHLAWCKQRALEYLPSKPDEAISSMLSDLGKHPETTKSAEIGQMLALPMMLSGRMSDYEVRRWVEGFN